MAPSLVRRWSEAQNSIRSRRPQDLHLIPRSSPLAEIRLACRPPPFDGILNEAVRGPHLYGVREMAPSTAKVKGRKVARREATQRPRLPAKFTQAPEPWAPLLKGQEKARALRVAKELIEAIHQSESDEMAPDLCNGRASAVLLYHYAGEVWPKEHYHQLRDCGAHKLIAALARGFERLPAGWPRSRSL